MKNITETFSKVDSKILELLKCASNDFMGLNTSFKEIAKESKEIINNSLQIHSTLDSVYNEGNAVLLKELEFAFADLIHHNRHIIEINNNLLDIIDHEHSIQLLLKNLNQNLLTLDFLFANFQLSETTSNNSNDRQNEVFIQKCVGMINNVRSSINSNYIAINAVTNTINTTIDKLNQPNQSLLHTYSLIQATNKITHSKKLDSNKALASIKNIQNNISENIAGIITNLQYHDIIKQKIDHVYHSQKEINSNTDTGDSTNNQTTTQYLSEIKDLANIQSAILVKANHEYQQAIESISALLKSICENVGHMCTVCNEMVSIKVNGRNISPMYLYNSIDSTNRLISDLFKSDYSAIANLTKTLEAINETTTKVLELKEIAIAEYCKKEIEDRNINNANNIPQQIITVIDDVENIVQKVKTICKLINTTTHNIQQIQEELQKGDNYQNLKDKVSDIYSKLLKSINQDITAINKYKAENKRINKSIKINVSTAINNISYYETFETIIIDIIQMLNNTFNELKGYSSTSSLDSIRKIYTMQSEHSIHTKIIDGIDSTIDDPSAEEGFIELF